MDRRKAIRIRAKDLTSVRPVAAYGAPSYPTRTEAHDLGFELFHVTDSLLKRYGRRALTGATMILLSTTGSCSGKRVDPCAGYPQLSELEAREIIVSRMADEGVVFEADHQFESGDLDVNLDGFDPTTRIGYEFYSFEDDDECERRCCGSAWESQHADWEEQVDHYPYAVVPGPDAIGFFGGDWMRSEEEARSALESQLEEFIDWLRENGRL